METDNLRTASVYINNLLLSRGLLKNGQNIDFAHPERGDGGVEGTMASIMVVVNDLILRRDRDATQRETLSNTIRSIRTDTLRQTVDLERLQSKHADAQRKLGLSEATERALKQHIRSAEQAAKGLKEEMARMRILVGQTRAQCANEVRKRERVIEGLKKHVGEGGRARGSGKAVGVATITVVPGVGALEGRGSVVGVEESNYDLRQETNEFLTELAKGLSEENENLGALLRRTVENLKSLSGWEKEALQAQQEGGLVVSVDDSYENIAAEIDGVIEHLQTLLTNPSFVPLEEVEIREDEIIRLRAGWERMEDRWRDAVQMMDGWRKRMARSGQTVNLDELKAGLDLSRVKEAEVERARNSQDLEDDYEEGDTQADIDAMDDSQVPGGDDTTPDLDEMSDASSFDDEPVEELVEEPVAERDEITIPMESSESSEDEDTDEQRQKEKEREERKQFKSEYKTRLENKRRRTLDAQQSPAASTPASKQSAKPDPHDQGLYTNRDHQEPLEKQSNRKIFGQKPKVDAAPSSSPGPPPQLSPFRSIPEADTRRNSGFSTIIEENTWDLAQLDRSSVSQPPADDPDASLINFSPSYLDAPIERTLSTPLKPTGSSRLPRPAPALPQQSPLTMASIAAKLAATEREADAARVRAKLKAAKLSSAAAAATTNLAPPPRREEGADAEPVKHDLEEEEAPTKKRKAAGRAAGRASRRRSTLSPWELESLILGGVGASPAK